MFFWTHINYEGIRNLKKSIMDNVMEVVIAAQQRKPRTEMASPLHSTRHLKNLDINVPQNIL